MKNKKVRPIKLPKMDIEAWKPWIDITTFDTISAYVVLDTTPEIYRPLVALAISVAKWHPQNRKRSRAPCGLCILYSNQNNSCTNCPLAKYNKRCFEESSLFLKTIENSKDYNIRTTYDDRLYLVLYRLYADEYQKVMTKTDHERGEPK